MSVEFDNLYDRVSEQETQLERQAIVIESLESEIENLKKRMDSEVKRLDTFNRSHVETI